MKKLVVFLVMAMMIVCFAGTASAATFSDTSSLDKNAQASIAKLNALDVINGYPDGTFKPANTITRAEFAKIAIILGGLGQSADVLKGSTTKFSDVAANQWYTGYINLAASQGYVKGFPDGTFRPNDKISYGQVVTVLLRVLGYNDNLPGPWPVDYIAKAGALDITKNVSLSANSDAPRVDVAIMSDAALDATIVKWDNDTESFEKDENGTTLLEDSFDAAVNDDYYIKDAKYDNGTWSIQVQATDEDEQGLVTFKDDNDGTQPSKWYDLADAVVVSDGSLPTGLDGKIADLVYNSDDKVIEFIDVTSSSATLDGEDLDVDSKDIKNGYATRYSVDNKKHDIADWVVNTANLLSAPSGDSYYKVYLNNDGEIYDVSKRNEGTPAIVEEYDADELTVKDPGNYKDNDQIEDIDFKSDEVLIESGGKFIEAKDLKENDLIYVEEDKYGYDYYIEVTAGIDKEGTLGGFEAGSGTAPDQIQIGGEWYDVADTSLLSTDGGDEFDKVLSDKDLKDSYDATIKYAVNKANQVCVAISNAGGTSDSTVYGVVTEIVNTNASGKITKIKILKSDDTEASYNVDTSDVEVYYTSSSKELDVDNFVKFTVNENNEIDGLTILAYDTIDAGTQTFTDPATKGTPNVIKDYSDTDNTKYIGKITGGNDDNNRITFNNISYKVNDSTIVFNANPTDAADDQEADIVSVSNLLDWAADSSIVNKYAYVQYNGSTVDYIFIDSDVSGSTDVNYAAVLKSYTKSGAKWVTIDTKGAASNYEIKGNTPTVDCIYDYSITSNKFNVKANGEVFNPATVATNAYKTVAKVDKTEKAITLTDGTNVMLDDDTAIYDYSDYYKDNGKSDPDYCTSISSISKNDKIIVPAYDDDGNANLIVIVNNINK